MKRNMTLHHLPALTLSGKLFSGGQIETQLTQQDVLIINLMSANVTRSFDDFMHEEF